MCFICIQLDKSFPSPKQLAKAYFETTLTGVDSPQHYELLEERMNEHIKKQQMSYEALNAYHKEFQEEYERLKGIGWPT
jgi:hypothetical protein